MLSITHNLSQARSAPSVRTHVVNLGSDFICENYAAQCNLDLLYLLPRFLFFSPIARNSPLMYVCMEEDARVGEALSKWSIYHCG